MEMDEKQKQELNKISDISSQSAADALSQMVSKEVSVKFPNIAVKPMDEIQKLNGDMIISLSELTGDVRGNILLAFPKEKGLTLLDIMMMQEQGTLKDMNEESTGAFNELNNIVGGAYVSAFANYLSFKVFPKPPKFIGDLNKIRDQLIGELNENSDNMLLIDTFFSIDSCKTDGLFIMLLDDESLNNLFDRLKKR